MSNAVVAENPPANGLSSGDLASSSATSQNHPLIDYVPNASFVFSADHTLNPLSSLSIQNNAGHGIPTDLPAYLGRLCEAELLTAEDEKILFRQMNYLKFLASELRDRLPPHSADHHALEAVEELLSQSRQIRDHIIKANMRLVISIVKKFVTPSQSFDEILSEGTITLMNAVEKFDFDRGFRFSTYAYRSISRTAYRFVATAREEEARLTRGADEWAFGQTDETQSSSRSDQLWKALRDFTSQMLQRLDRRERFIIRCRFALGSHHRVRSLQELANKLGVSKERVRQLEGRAVSKLQAMANELDLDQVRISAN